MTGRLLSPSPMVTICLCITSTGSADGRFNYSARYFCARLSCFTICPGFSWLKLRFTICFTIPVCLCPDLDGNRGTTKMCPERPAKGPETQIRSHRLRFHGLRSGTETLKMNIARVGKCGRHHRLVLHPSSSSYLKSYYSQNT